MNWMLALVMGWVLLSTLTLLGVRSCDGSGCCEGKWNNNDLTDKVEANTLWVNNLGVSSCAGMGAVE